MVNKNSLIDTQAQDDIMNSDMDKREFKITVGIRSYWITKEELEKYLTERKKPGVDLVALRGGMLFLPSQCQEIVHRSVIDDSEKIEKGKWQCEYGKWHPNDVECFCGDHWVETGEGTLRLERQPIPELASSFQ